MDINSNMDVNDVKHIISSKINKELDDLHSIKYQLTVKMSLSKNNSEYTELYFQSNQEVITEYDTINWS